jgi:hypothetical protein
MMTPSLDEVAAGIRHRLHERHSMTKTIVSDRGGPNMKEFKPLKFRKLVRRPDVTDLVADQPTLTATYRFRCAARLRSRHCRMKQAEQAMLRAPEIIEAGTTNGRPNRLLK